MEKRCLYIVLTRTNTVISKLIHVIKNDEYTHAAIAFDRELDHMYSFGRKYTFNPFIGVFKQEEINQGIYKLCKTVPSLVIELQVSNRQYEKARILLDHFILNSNLYKYNYMGLLHDLLRKPVCYDDRFLCSEFVYHVLKESGIADLGKSRNLIRPQNLLAIKGETVYKGNLNNLKSIYGAGPFGFDPPFSYQTKQTRKTASRIVIPNP